MGRVLQSLLAAEHERSCTVRSKPTRRRVTSIQSSIAEILGYLQQEQQPSGDKGGDTKSNDDREQGSFSRS